MKQETKNELASMLEAAEKKIADADKELTRIQAEREDAKSEASQLRGILARNGGTNHGAESPATREMQRPLKFRDAIRDAVDSSKAAVSINEVVESVKAKGFEEEGATPLAVRVGNELHRLTGLGQIERAARGSYVSKKP